MFDLLVITNGSHSNYATTPGAALRDKLNPHHRAQLAFVDALANGYLNEPPL
jgi:hypothetical protein